MSKLRINNRQRQRIRPLSAGVSAYPETNSDPNVVALWYFDEASGDIVDEISGLTVTKVGSPTYSVSATGLFSAISPGINIPTTSDRFANTSAQPAIEIGTGDYTVEYYYKNATSAGTQNLIDCRNSADGYKGFSLNHQGSVNIINVVLRATDSTLVSPNFTVSGIDIDDGNIHKVRVAMNRAADMTLYVDGTNQGTQALSTLSGKTVSFYYLQFSGWVGGGTPGWLGTIYTMRFSQNATNNLGGPGGG